MDKCPEAKTIATGVMLWYLLKYTKPVPGRPKISQLNPVRIVEEVVRDIRDDVRRVSEPR